MRIAGIRAIPDAVNRGVVGTGSKEYNIIKNGTFQPGPDSFLPINSMSSILCRLINFDDNAGIILLSKYLPKVDPKTPATNTPQVFKPKRNWKNTITGHAGGPKNGSISTPIEHKNTSA